MPRRVLSTSSSVGSASQESCGSRYLRISASARGRDILAEDRGRVGIAGDDVSEGVPRNLGVEGAGPYFSGTKLAWISSGASGTKIRCAYGL